MVQLDLTLADDRRAASREVTPGWRFVKAVLVIMPTPGVRHRGSRDHRVLCAMGVRSAAYAQHPTTADLTISQGSKRRTSLLKGELGHWRRPNFLLLE